MKHILTMVLSLTVLFTFAQSLKPIDLVTIAQEKQVSKSYILWKKSTQRSNVVLPNELKVAQVLEVNPEEIKALINEEAPHINLQLPLENETNITLDLVEVNPLSVGSSVRIAPSMQAVSINTGKHYRGIIQGDMTSIVALSVFDGEVMGLISSNRFNGNLVLGKLEDNDYHILYEDQQIASLNHFECMTEDNNLNYSAEQLRYNHSERDLNNCVNLYLEVNTDIYNNKGSISATTNYVTGLFNQVATLYANEQINVTVSDIVIWTSQSPYTSTTSSGMLSQFTAYRQGFNGDLAQLLSYQASGGIAYLDGLCRSNPDYSMSYAGISSTYQNVPTYSWSVMVCTHEFGHLMGSNHTHACAWNGNNTAIDGCYTTEGSCPNPGIPQGGGTIMSYCHLTSAGINLNLGFGPQPGNVIRSEVSNASCLTACSGGSDTCNDGIQNGNETGVDCGGSCVPCDTGGNEGTLVAGHYFESGWDNWIDGGSNCYRYGGSLSPEGTYSIRLRNKTGAASTMTSPTFDLSTFDTVAISFKFYATSFEAGEDFWLNYFDGTSWTTVRQYVVGTDFSNNTQSSKTFTMVGLFPSNAKISFQADAGDNTDIVYIDAIEIYGFVGSDIPTCNDGIQNGDETGVDCGGSCAPCGGGGGGSSSEEISGHYFESGWDNWTDGGSDCYRYYGSISPEGSYSIRLRDNSGAGSTMFSPSYDFTPYNALDIQFQFYAVNMLPGQSLKINYFNGNTWSTVYSLISGSHFNNNIDYTATLTLTGTLDNNAKIAFECDGSDNNNLVYVDAVVLTGYYGSSLIEDQVQLSINPLHKTRIVDDNTLKDVQVYPNPALEQVKINAEEKILEVHIYSMEGKLLKALSPNDASTTIQIDEFNSGVLLFEIKTEESQTIEKIIKL